MAYSHTHFLLRQLPYVQFTALINDYKPQIPFEGGALKMLKQALE